MVEHIRGGQHYPRIDQGKRGNAREFTNNLVPVLDAEMGTRGEEGCRKKLGPPPMRGPQAPNEAIY